jgi:hypothetical protein
MATLSWQRARSPLPTPPTTCPRRLTRAVPPRLLRERVNAESPLRVAAQGVGDAGRPSKEASPPSPYYTLYSSSGGSNTSPTSVRPSLSLSHPPLPLPGPLAEIRGRFHALGATEWALFENAGGSQVPSAVASAVWTLDPEL